MKLFEEIISQKIIYRLNQVTFNVNKVRLPNGDIVERPYVEHPGAVAILAINSKNECALVCQFRMAIDSVLLEIPAGKLDKIKKEDITQGALRELEEEVGVIAGKIQLLAALYTSPGFLSEKMYIYLATDLKPGKQNLDGDEFLNVDWMPVSELQKKIDMGIIEDGKTILALSLYKRMLEKDKI